MAAEAKRLIAGKAPKAEGSVELMGTVFRASIRWRVEGSILPARGPRRAEKRRAEEDLECMREASSRHEDVLASRKAVDAEVRRLQQQAETEQRVELFAHRLSQQKAHLQLSVGQQQQQPVPEQQARHAQSHQASEELSGSEDEWEVEEVDDGMVAYAWKSKDELLQQWDEQQIRELPLTTSCS